MVYESPSPGRDAFFKEAVFKYALYEPGLLEPEASAKCSSPAIPMNNFCRWSSDQRSLGRWRQRQFLYLNLSEVMAGGVSKGHALEAVAKKLATACKIVLRLVTG